MTPDQEKQWNEFGCAPRCLLELSKRKGKTISRDTLVQKYDQKYPDWKTRCGITDTGGIIDIARDFNLCTSAVSIRNKEHIKRRLNKNPNLDILVLTDIINNDPDQECFHCMLLLSFDHKNSNWSLWNPNQDGTDSEGVVTDTRLEELCAHFLVLA